MFHNCSWDITYCRMAASPYPAYRLLTRRPDKTRQRRHQAITDA
ncbi:hypothetical protein CIT292_09765 [Citrobacter youngae ATCC 29220]|uniref:Uncharacterized protein n=1 Tax=Citrobacter youngae ATCC 29220 TaxID=500640 RepID=D4BGW0_9ENTR|nr:hypothetical protein CIT292_09765 [Citrobacter youngae ATCC 29220]